jgi:hypothetical protein
MTRHDEKEKTVIRKIYIRQNNDFVRNGSQQTNYLQVTRHFPMGSQVVVDCCVLEWISNWATSELFYVLLQCERVLSCLKYIGCLQDCTVTLWYVCFRFFLVCI